MVSPATSRASSQPPSEYSATPPLSPSIGGTFDFDDMSASLELPTPVEEPIETSFSHAKLLEEVRKATSASGARSSASMIVIGALSQLSHSTQHSPGISELCRTRRCRQIDVDGSLVI